MKEVGSPKKLFENLDSSTYPTHPLERPHKTGPGRPVQYNPESDLKALMLRQLLQIPYIKDLVKRLRREAAYEKPAATMTPSPQRPTTPR